MDAQNYKNLSPTFFDFHKNLKIHEKKYYCSIKAKMPKDWATTKIEIEDGRSLFLIKKALTKSANSSVVDIKINDFLFLLICRLV